MNRHEITAEPNVRFVYFSDGGHAKLIRENPYGFWRIKWHVGSTPAAIDQTYTGVDLARAAVERYVNSSDYNGYAKPVEEKVEMAPPIQYKKKYRKEEANQ